MRISLIAAFTIFVSLASFNQSFGQACSCGGVPLLGSLESTVSPKGKWTYSFSYAYNSISDLFTETEEFQDDTRSRSVHTGLLEVGYGVAERISLSVIVSYLQQERQTNSALIGSDLLRVRGVGDGLIVVKYALIPFNVHSLRQLSIGGGIKIPFGDSNLKQNNNLISADLQPGTGSYDYFIISNLSQGFYRKLPVTWYSNLSYRINGTNDRFDIDGLGYKFGNELIFATGFAYDTSPSIAYSIGLNFRNTTRDTFDNLDFPNTGGFWLNLEPGGNIKINKSMELRGALQLPVYRSVNGTQLTTSFSLSFALNYIL